MDIKPDEATGEGTKEVVSISFDCQYKGHIKDSLREKSMKFLSTFFLGLVLLAVAVYMTASITGNMLFGYIFYFVSVGVLVSAFIAPFFDRKNFGLKGTVEMDFYPESLEYEVRGRQRHAVYCERSKILYMAETKRTFLFGKGSSKCYRVPKACITREQSEALTLLKDKLNEIKKAEQAQKSR